MGVGAGICHKLTTRVNDDSTLAQPSAVSTRPPGGLQHTPANCASPGRVRHRGATDTLKVSGEDRRQQPAESGLLPAIRRVAPTARAVGREPVD